MFYFFIGFQGHCRGIAGVLQGSRIGTGDAVGRLGLAIDAVRHYQPVAASRNCCGSPGERQRPDGRGVPALGIIHISRLRCARQAQVS